MDHEKFRDGDLPNPCGLMARFFPRDSFNALQSKNNDEQKALPFGGSQLTVADQVFDVVTDKDKISDPFFAQNFHHNADANPWLNVEDGRFINWMVV